jgi:hypothetical protein
MNTVAYLKEKNLSGDDKTISSIREDFKAYGIKVSYSPNEKDRRVIFSSMKQFRKSEETDLFISECNGLLLQSGTWDPLVIPPQTFKSNINVDEVNYRLAREEYEVFEAQDGTVVSLYYFDKSWHLSTTKGFDVTKLKWNGLIYNQVLKEVLRSIEVDVAGFYTSLDVGKSYTFCFTHPKFHPFKGSQEYKLTFIQAADLSTFEISYENPFEVSKIPDQVSVENVTNVRELFKKLPVSLKEYYKTGDICHGYIIRIKPNADSEDVSFKHVLLESRLLQTIRKLYYNGKYNLEAKNRQFNREKYVIVNAFLNKTINDNFLLLFPQFEKYFSQLEQISIDLVKKMVSIHEHIADSDEEIPSNTADKLTSSAEFLLNELAKVFTLNIKHRDSIRVISSFILDTVYVDIFYYLFTQP